MSNYEELIRPEFEVQCKKLGRGIERGVHSGEYASLPTYDAWEALKSATSPLLAALEEKDQQINSWRNLAKQNIAEREKDIAALDVARQQNAELQQRLQQPIKLPPLMSENIFGGTPQCHMVANAHNNAITACSMSIRDAGFKSECTVWKESKEE